MVAAAAAAKSLQSCLTLCDPIDGSPPGSLVPGILQARTLEWVAISFSSAWKWEVKVKSLSLVRLLATPWIAAYQAPPSMGFSRQEYWSGVPVPSPISELVATLLDSIGRSNKLQETYCQDTDGPSQLTHQSQYCLESWNDLNLLGQHQTHVASGKYRGHCVGFAPWPLDWCTGGCKATS